jgi:hypothetical protein
MCRGLQRIELTVELLEAVRLAAMQPIFKLLRGMA